MKIRLQFTIDKDYYIDALTYWMLCDLKNHVNNLTKKEADKIIRDRLYWSGKSNWVGDGGTEHEMLGDATETYNEYQVIVSEWVNKKYKTI